ncbi:transglycosylase family protein [Arthrobacter sp. AOP36-A1-22]|uniref:transglycosylase family protein n=1 Tax=Arthrobacter sp. AOP36-A1-22 TaxID=3457684 RepID=UPI004034C0AA
MQIAFKNRWVKTGAQAVALTALILGLVSFVGANKTVAVTVDGETQSVQAYAGTVGEMLSSADINIDADDEVSPGVDTAVADGDAITVNRNKSVDVSIDGVDRVVHTTGLTVADVLDQLNVGDAADVSNGPQLELASLSTPLQISTVKTLKLNADGKTRSIKTTEGTVGDALKSEGVKIGADDELSVAAATELKDGLKVKLVRVKTTTDTDTRTVAHGVEKNKDGDLALGKTKTVTAGKDGERTLTYTVTTRDGKEESRKLTSNKVTTKPVDAEVALGTKKPEKKEEPEKKAEPAKKDDKPDKKEDKPVKKASTGGTTASSGGVSANWKALAKCESGGNWSINTGNGYYGGLQFNRNSWIGAGGGKYAALPHQATPSQQVAVAEKLRANGGWGHWPACSSKLGLR